MRGAAPAARTNKKLRIGSCSGNSSNSSTSNAMSRVQPTGSIRVRPGDNVETRVQQIVKQFRDGGKSRVITLTNADPACQKMVSILELAKQRILEDEPSSFHQYNKIEYELSSKPPKKHAATASEELTDLPKTLVNKKRTEFIYPKLTIKLSHSSLPLSEDEGWFHQKVT